MSEPVATIAGLELSWRFVRQGLVIKETAVLVDVSTAVKLAVESA